MYFKLFKPRDWRKRSAEARGRNCAVLPQKQENGAMNGQNSTKKKNAATTAALIAVVVLVMAGVFVLLYVTALAPLMQKRPAPTPQETVQEQPEPQLPTTPAVPEADKPEAKTYPHAEEDDATRTLDLEVYSEGVLLIDAQTNTVVAEKNPDARIYPASMTKVMTALVACEKIENWDDTFTMTQEIIDPLYLADASLAGFVNGEKVPMLDLVYGAILPSGAEATEALAIYVAGSEAAYAELMNEKAAELGLKDTHFVDASGLHDENHYTTLRDMAVILQAAMDNETCREVLSTTYYTCQPTEQHPEGLKIFNKFLSRVENRDRAGAEILGAKTGYTAQAMNCCASFGVSPKGRSLVCVTSKAWTSDFCIDDHIALYSKYGE